MLEHWVNLTVCGRNPTMAQQSIISHFTFFQVQITNLRPFMTLQEEYTVVQHPNTSKGSRMPIFPQIAPNPSISMLLLPGAANRGHLYLRILFCMVVV